MPLPSQSSRGRGNSSVRFSVKRRRKRSGPLPRVLALLVIAPGLTVGAWYLFLKDPAVSDDPIAANDADEQSQPEPEQDAEPSPLERAASNTDALGPPTRLQASTGAAPTTPDPDVTPAPPTEPVTRTPDPEPDPVPPAPVEATPSTTESAIASAQREIEAGRLPRARDILNRALFDAQTSEPERARLRDRLSELAATMTFGRALVPGDDTVREYRIQSGDRLSTVAVREDVGNSWQFIARVNGIADASRIRVGQRIKLVNGPFHAVVHKNAYRLDLFLEDRDSAGNHLFVRSFDVGLGEFDSTPTGAWIVKNREKNPSWVNPRNPQERYGRDDPDNPIGDFWVGLEGDDDQTRLEVGYGLHGTIEPDSIGKQMSMGCVRLLDDDIALLFEVMVPEQSRVVITD